MKNIYKIYYSTDINEKRMVHKTGVCTKHFPSVENHPLKTFFSVVKPLSKLQLYLISNLSASPSDLPFFHLLCFLSQSRGL